MPVRTLGLIFVLLLPLAGPRSDPVRRGSAQGGEETARQVLEAYGAGRYEDVGPLLSGLRIPSRFSHELWFVSDTWVAAVSGAERERRLRVASLVALEVYHLAIGTREFIRPGDAEDVVGWASRQLATRPPDAYEHLWYLAAVALAEGAGAEAFLTGRANGFVVSSEYGPLLEDASRRFPGEPRFALARVAFTPAARTVANRPGALVPFLARRKLRSEVEEDLAKALRDLDALSREPAVGFEAKLRAGMIRFHLNRLDESLSDLAAAARATEPFVACLAWLMQGHVLRELGRLPEAVGAYERAADIMPQAGSVATSLGASLFLVGRREEAYAAVRVALEGSPPSEDPWRRYGLGDYRFWPQYLAQLRELMRP